MTATDAKAPTFTAMTVKFSEGKDIGAGVSIAPSWIVYGGEYPEDMADVLVTVHHAVNEDGEDITQDVAYAIAAALDGNR